MSTDLSGEDSDTESYTSSGNNDENNVEDGCYLESEIDDDILPNPSVSACKTLLKNPMINSGITESTKIYTSIGTQNMNKINSFWLKFE